MDVVGRGQPCAYAPVDAPAGADATAERPGTSPGRLLVAYGLDDGLPRRRSGGKEAGEDAYKEAGQ